MIIFDLPIMLRPFSIEFCIFSNEKLPRNENEMNKLCCRMFDVLFLTRQSRQNETNEGLITRTTAKVNLFCTGETSCVVRFQISLLFSFELQIQKFIVIFFYLNTMKSID